MILQQVAIGANPPELVNVIVEITPETDSVKYELDKASGALMVDRFLSTSMRYPCSYGFIPHTLSEDGDPCDVLVLCNRALLPGCVVPARPIGVLLMQDEAGGDEKILAVPQKDHDYESVKSIEDLPRAVLLKISHFFEQYKALEKDKWAKVESWQGVQTAHLMINKAIQRHKCQI